MSHSDKFAMTGQLVDLDTLKTKIESGSFLSIAADEAVLKQLPAGNWIAGTIPYFMTDEGGAVSEEKIFVHELTGFNRNTPPRITIYDENSISRIAKDAPAHGFTVLILPFSSNVHVEYAKSAPEFPNMFFSPIVGWIAGFHLDKGSSAKAAFGPGGSMLMDQQAVAMHVTLPDHQVATINTINLFSEGSGPKIEFQKTGFEGTDCIIDGTPAKLAEFIQEHNIDTRLPLVADYSGLKMNVSIKAVDNAANTVDLYAPVFEGFTYHFAEPVNDYVGQFEAALSSNDRDHVSFSCNCILNFLYSELEGKKTAHFTGPITFGEVAYQLLNQTLVYMTISES